MKKESNIMPNECALYAWSENASTTLFLYNIWVYLKNEEDREKMFSLVEQC